MISIQTNVNSLVAQQNLNTNSIFQSKTIEQLTSGYRINQSGDDAAGLAVANKYRSSIAELTQGVSNGNDGVASLQIMDGGISNIGQMLDRLKTLAMQSASGSFTGGVTGRAQLNSEFQTDITEIDRQAQSIGLNTGGTLAQNLAVYLGAGSGSTSQSNSVVNVNLSGATVDSQALGLSGMQASSTSGSDLSAAEITGIVGDTTNAASISAGQTDFKFSGAGFGTDGTNTVDVKVATGGVTSVATLVQAINQGLTATGQTNANFLAAGITANISANSTGQNVLTFTSAKGAFQVQAGDLMANALLGNLGGNGVTGAALASTVVGPAYDTTGKVFTAGQIISYTVSGGGLTVPQSFNVTATAAETASGMADQIAADVASHSALTSAGISATNDTANHQLDFSSSTGQGVQVKISGDNYGTTATSNLMGYGAFEGEESTTITAPKAFVTGTATGNVDLDVSVGGAVGDRLTVANGIGDSINTTAQKINTAILAAGASSTWQTAGIVASVTGGNLVLTSTNGTNFRVGSSNDTSSDEYLGFTSSAAAGVAAVNVATPFAGTTAATANFVSSNSQGDFQLANSGGTAATPLAFNNMAFGSDTQSLTLSAADATGANHTVGVQLTAANAGSIDAAIAAINTAIQGSGDTTLMGISAVKANVEGTEEIQFSGPAKFNVNIGSTTTGAGVQSQGDTLGSLKVGTGGAIDISTAADAAAAVAAISNAVGILGTAQAAVGVGENQLGYAISLAQSQITNFSAAESNIRDANVAQEAANLTKAQVLQQASIAAMAQANSAPQAILTLLRG